MKRKITSKLYEWKNMLNGRMPLLIYGARQVGKTFEMREFGALYYIFIYESMFFFAMNSR